MPVQRPSTVRHRTSLFEDAVAIIVAWVRDARRELEDLPLEHHVATHDTVPRPQDRPRSS